MKKFAIASVLFIGCQNFPPGENILIQEVLNPKGSMKVIVFEKGGNATVSNSIQLLLAGYDYELKKADNGNILTADGIDGLGIAKDQIFRIEWKNDTSLVINYPNALRLFKKAQVFEGFMGKITIDYSPIE